MHTTVHFPLPTTRTLVASLFNMLLVHGANLHTIQTGGGAWCYLLGQRCRCSHIQSSSQLTMVSYYMLLYVTMSNY